MKASFARHLDDVKKSMKGLGYVKFAETSSICDDEWLKAFMMIAAFIKYKKISTDGCDKVQHLPENFEDMNAYFMW